MSQLPDERVPWDYYDKYKETDQKYLPPEGEGDNMATQIVTATTKLVYKWYNDGDVFDNTYHLEGWANDLSSYANWLEKHVPQAKPILACIAHAETNGQYENLLKQLVDATNDKDFLNEQEKLPKQGTIYDCDGPYEFVEDIDDEEDDGGSEFYDEDERW